METKDVLFSSISMSDLSRLLRDIVTDVINQEKKTQLQEKFLSVKETCNLFQPAISRQTLNNWANKGLIKKHKLNGSVYFKYTEVVEAMNYLEKYGRLNHFNRVN